MCDRPQRNAANAARKRIREISEHEDEDEDIMPPCPRRRRIHEQNIDEPIIYDNLEMTAYRKNLKRAKAKFNQLTKPVTEKQYETYINAIRGPRVQRHHGELERRQQAEDEARAEQLRIREERQERRRRAEEERRRAEEESGESIYRVPLNQPRLPSDFPRHVRATELYSDTPLKDFRSLSSDNNVYAFVDNPLPDLRPQLSGNPDRYRNPYFYAIHFMGPYMNIVEDIRSNRNTNLKQNMWIIRWLLEYFHWMPQEKRDELERFKRELMAQGQSIIEGLREMGLDDNLIEDFIDNHLEQSRYYHDL